MDDFYPVTDQDSEVLDNSFTYHTPKGNQQTRYEMMRRDARSLANTILRCAPKSRERSLAITHLENAIMWANKAIACNE